MNMKRLTIRNADGSVSQPTDLNWAEALEKLAAYEDTGLTPAEIKNVQDYVSFYRYSLSSVSPIRAVELADADKDGRVVVFPVKVGDVVYCLQDYFNDATLRSEKRITIRMVDFVASAQDLFETDGLIYKFRDIGKTVFLTYEAAVAALKEVEKNA